MIRIYPLLLVIISLLLYGIYKQYQVEKLKAKVEALSDSNSVYKKKIKAAEDRFNMLRGRLSYLNVEAASLKSDIIFIKSNPGEWSLPETEESIQQLQSGIAEAENSCE